MEFVMGGTFSMFSVLWVPGYRLYIRRCAALLVFKYTSNTQLIIQSSQNR